MGRIHERRFNFVKQHIPRSLVLEHQNPHRMTHLIRRSYRRQMKVRLCNNCPPVIQRFWFWIGGLFCMDPRAPQGQTPVRQIAKLIFLPRLDVVRAIKSSGYVPNLSEPIETTKTDASSHGVNIEKQTRISPFLRIESVPCGIFWQLRNFLLWACEEGLVLRHFR